MPFEVKKAESVLGLAFKDKALLKKAFRHRSYLNEAGKALKSNERLEFLGDAILEFIVSEYIYQTYQEQPEGNLTSMRAKLVCTQNLARISQNLGLGQLLLLSRGEDLNQGRQNPNILADLLEAVIGAIYLDQGLNKTKQFVYQHILKDANKFSDFENIKSSKNQLQELIQKKYQVTPEYKVLAEKPNQDASDHFLIGVYLQDRLLAKGQAKTKKQAQEKAAQAALSQLKTTKLISHLK